jgi:hypothetical protein
MAPLFRRRPKESGTALLSVMRAGAMLAETMEDLDERTLHLMIATDGAIIGDGIDSRAPITEETVERAAARWGPRLRGLQDARLYFVGVGMGSQKEIDIDGCEAVVRAVAAACDADVRVWGQTLGEAFA